MNRLFELRSEANLSQRAIAKLLNISQGTYNNWENSNTQPSIEQLIELSRLFKVSVDYIICNSDEYGIIDTKEKLSDEQKFLLELFGRLDRNGKTSLLELLKSATKNRNN
ncbi:MAG TPA: helix-turn-helix transcriptional regulator [Candidatus Ornithoclostridium faecavium]|nr:helix-turn-helix transcriptional regulator [Candidatus Ornithoclostridium faecavium]